MIKISEKNIFSIMPGFTHLKNAQPVSFAHYLLAYVEMFIRDKKRVIPCASLCEGEFGIDGYFIGVPTVIGCGGVEKILTFDLNEEEQNALNNTLTEVEKTVLETKL